MEIIIFIFSMGVIFGTIIAGIGIIIYDKKYK